MHIILIYAFTEILCIREKSYFSGGSDCGFATYRLASRHGLALADKAGTYRGLLTEHASYPGTLESLVAKGEVALRAAAETLVRTGEAVDLGVVKLSSRSPRTERLFASG
jgi:hypothetical protein